jgi:hypothetical protein
MPISGPLERLEEPVPDADWERVRDLEAEELRRFPWHSSADRRRSLNLHLETAEDARSGLEEFTTVRKAKNGFS